MITPGTVAAPSVEYRDIPFREKFAPKKQTDTGSPLEALMEAGSMSTRKAAIRSRRILRALRI